MNYRKPVEQRLIVRIQLMVPLFATSCYVSLRWFPLSKFVEPVKEIYEAFVIYTFFSLLTLLLGGERNIVIITSGRPPVKHPPPFKKVLPAVDMSDPFTLLAIKRGILQYVWLKPVICLMTALVEVGGWETVLGINPYFVINLTYNVSASISLYELALFWKCMYDDLMPFNPWGKFLCVKLIIFASYWQGITLALLSWLGVLKPSTDTALDSNDTLGFAIQNALLCVELIGFAIGHWHSFSWTEYRPEALPGCGRLSYAAALRDAFGCGDLIYDFKSTFEGDDYDYRRFDSVEALIAHPTSRSRMARLNQGLRFTDSGKQKYWLPNSKVGNGSTSIKTPLLQKPRAGSIASTNFSTKAIYANSMLTVNSKEYDGASNGSMMTPSLYNYNTIEEGEPHDATDDDALLEEYVYDEEVFRRAKRERPFGDKNYPVIYDTEAHAHSPAVQRLRREAMERQSESV